MTLFSDLRWRGLIHQTTNDEGIDAWLAEKQRTLYAGFDPTASSLHVGSLMGLLMLRRFQQAGHRPIAVVGGATGMIGDPSGKSDERNLLSKEQLQENVEGLGKQMARFLDFDDSKNPALLVNNFDWTGNWTYLDFLRDIGKNFPVNVMLAKDSVKSRLGRGEDAGSAGMSYTEFSYMLLQAYDFVHLSNEYGCELQAGGSDQWGNITAGIDLARRMRGTQLYGLTWPLLTKSDGTKMGKTESGAVWLDAERTSPYQFYQYWINVDDADAGNCLRLLTELSQDVIELLDIARVNDPGKRESQRRLAEELTRLVHGEVALATAQKATEIFFGAEIADLSDAQLTEIFADVPSKSLSRSRLGDGTLTIVDALVESGLSKTKGEARRTVEQGGAYINNRRIEGIDALLSTEYLASESVMVLRSGKKKYALLRFE
ncbi:tyrosine--tRNA ligase [Bythopirellula polymerisocia]|uniref:Tyrosine--tRNA ligase n=1 Tax=Bythopirellula polymerisocia TaxID=2528003 RepID=A0A5C6CQH4_9BACT|nr:tyrosine--tRNA ligase [Bythopirellula polymerisocia]TWU25764.1 Tyrosine--tRNA ligase [Bythopirellula polymerisocia]